MVIVRDIVWTKKFELELRKLKDSAMKNRVKEQIKKIIEDSETGNPLRFALNGERSVYVSPYRLIYAVQGETLYLLRFEHRRTEYR